MVQLYQQISILVLGYVISSKREARAFQSLCLFRKFIQIFGEKTKSSFFSGFSVTK
ncbi:hypothetical protein LEP1GSC109_2345 [Leptospira interrogans str. UI 13372]|nr:hypothetical protein LEP1GSC109_2345 [Leptospira interrogans str. UI 13372]